MKVKNFLKSSLPKELQNRLRENRRFVRNLARSVKAFFKPSRINEDWSRWYKKDFLGPERCFGELKTSIPSHVKNVIDFGCAAGRNLSAFNGEYNLYGVDIVDKANIEWRMQFQSLTYIQSPLQDLAIEEPLDDFLCISHGCIMYLNKNQQREFMQYLVDKGCRNFIFQEYDRRTLHLNAYSEKGPKVGYPFENFLNLRKQWFREDLPTWIRLEGRP